jgi:hypothetical protein
VLQQLARLTVRVPAASPRACAIAVYTDDADQIACASDRGYEGVACVDDAARAAVLFCDVWGTTRLPYAAAWARSFADFLFYMQDDEGRFVNFIANWDGVRNTDGPTSFAGGGFWQARGTRALAKLWMVLGDERAHERLLLALPRIREATDVPADVRAIHVHMASELLRVGAMPQLRGDLEKWADELAARRNGAVLLDNPDQTAPHLWAHIQEGVLAEAGALLDRPDLLAVARESALAYLAPLVESGFDTPSMDPYGVASAVYSLEKLEMVTGDAQFTDLAAKARAWFDGRNPARRPVYDRRAGRVHDGIDDGVLNRCSGAEANIVGAQALLADVIASAPMLLSAA